MGLKRGSGSTGLRKNYCLLYTMDCSP